MSTIVTRAGKGSPLTHNEVDANFNNLNTDKVEKTAAAITGGTINGTTIGATTPAAGTFTTITGQTEVLRGTGQNLLLQSNTFTTTWVQSFTSVATTVATTDPFGGNSAWILTEDSSTNLHRLNQAPTTVNATYTISCYFKANTRIWAYLRLVNSSNTALNAWFNLSTGVVGTVDSGLTATITSIGSGWYRCTATITNALAGANNMSLGMSNADNTVSYTGNGTSSIYLYGAQLEIASSAGSFVSTTTTAVYGTPTLSFSGVSTLGLEQTGALYLQPAGTGAIQAQATTSTTAGGNARGANAVDWQTSRSAAGQVASGSYAVISGGSTNTASGFNSSILGGAVNSSTNNYTFVGGGYSNAVSGALSVVNGGYTNTAAGFLNFIGGGFTNSGTSGSAVTTQATTTFTSGSTAVTLSGSNANIKVGQLITGTGIQTFPYTYVAAISGTSLTLSQNATATGTPTLSFFTPHGVVVGGGNNQATGAYSFIGGGGDAGTASFRNTASGDWSVVCGGTRNTASGIASFVGGGGVSPPFGTFPNTASGQGGAVVGGFLNTASGQGSFVGGGYSNTANSTYSAIMGGNFGITRGIVGYHTFPAHQSPISDIAGVSQSSLLVLGVQTTDATATVLRSNNSAAGTTNQVILPNNSAYYFKIEVIAGKTAAGDSKAVELKGAIKRGANAASTTLIGSVTSTVIAEDAGASAWTAVATADTTNGGIKLTVTGQASTTIRWVARVTTTEMTF